MLRLRTATASKVVPGRGPEGTTDTNEKEHHHGGMDRDRGQKKEAAWRGDNEGSGKLIGGAIVSCGCWAGGGGRTRGDDPGRGRGVKERENRGGNRGGGGERSAVPRGLVEVLVEA